MDGTPIYDKPYPLFNFCLAFYYKLNAADQEYNILNLTNGAPMVNVTAINITPTALSIAVGQSSKITSSLTPINSTNSSVIWTSDNPSIAYVIDGVVTAVGIGKTLINAKYVDQGLSINCEVTCTGLAEQGFYNSAPSTIDKNIEFENFNTGGEGVAYHDITPGNSAGVYRTNVNVDITTCSEGGYMVNSTAAGEWMNYLVNIPTTGNFNISIRYAASAASKVHFEVNGVKVSGSIDLPATYTASTLVFNSVSALIILTFGIQNLRFVIDSGNGNFSYFKIDTLTGFNLNQSIISESLKIYPVPANDIVEIAFNSVVNQYSKYEIIDMRGCSIIKSGFGVIFGDNYKRINISKLREGMYLM